MRCNQGRSEFSGFNLFTKYMYEFFYIIYELETYHYMYCDPW